MIIAYVPHNCMIILGFGSTIHVEASMLSTAMRLGRVLIKNTAGEEKYRPGGFLFFKKK
jgi:hypothetical protein